MMRLADAYSESEEESEEEDVKPGVPEATSVCPFAPSIPRFAFDSTLQSSEYESDSEEEEKPKLQFRPVFVPKCVYTIQTIIRTRLQGLQAKSCHDR